jgi:potassium/hydrogen antiporter
MTGSIVITICALMLLAYMFELTSSKTKIPSIILLLVLGWLVKQITAILHINIPNLEIALPVLGNIGLILIVLEGSLELELSKKNYPIIGKSAIIALLPMVFLSLGIAYAFYYFDPGLTYKSALANAIPLGVISSAVAISSVKNLNAANKEIITYESSMSDVLGVIFFNFITLNNTIETSTFGYFFLDLIIILAISIVATMVLALLLSKIKHHVKFAPIIILLIMIYFISKIYHLPALVFILLFGLLIGNLDEIKNLKFIKILHPEILNKEVYKFKELNVEFTFLIRTLFFILFGYLIKTSEVLNTDTILWAIGITAFIFLLRAAFLKVVRLPLKPLFFIAPRGLITILLFLTIPEAQRSQFMNNSLIIQVILITVIVMMVGLMFNKKDKPVLETEVENKV